MTARMTRKDALAAGILKPSRSKAACATAGVGRSCAGPATPRLIPPSPAAAPPKAKARDRHEDKLQITVADFCRQAIKRPDRWWFVPNGGNLSKAQAGQFQRMGLTPGVVDLHFAWAFGAQRQFPAYGVIELKWGKNKPTAEQGQFMDDMEKLGHTRAVCYTPEAVEATLRGWGMELHATLGRQGIVLSGASMRVKRST